MNWTMLLVVAVIVAVVLGLAITAMAVGVIFSNRRIQGSCGGLANMRGDGKGSCMACGGTPESCETADETTPARSPAAETH